MKILRSFLLFCLLAFASVIDLSGQTPFFRKIPLSGVSDEFRINSICQDSAHIIWIGTNEGLFKFDGLSYSKVKLPEKFIDLNITVVAPFGEKGIIAGTQSGIVFKSERGKWKLISNDSLKINSAISAIVVVDTSTFWVGTKGDGLVEMRNDWFQHHNVDNGLADNYIYTLCFVDDKIWMGSDRGISCIYKENGKHVILNINTSSGLPDNIVRNILKGPGTTIGLGMEEKGFCMYDYAEKEFVYHPYFTKWNKGPVTSSTLLENEFWIGTSKDGIVDYEFKAGLRIRQFSAYDGFSGKDINSIISDHEGNVWIGAGNELFLSPGEKIEYQKGLGQEKLGSIRSMLVDENDNIWLSNNNGVFYYNRNYSVNPEVKYPFKGTPLNNYTVISFYQDSYGYIWMGTFDHGVIRYDVKTGNFIVVDEKYGLINPNVLSMAGNEKEIWFATLGGVSRCDISDATLNGIKNFVGFSEEHGLGNNFIYKVFIDSKNRVWFGTDGKGITRFENGKFTNFNTALGLKSNVIYSITEDKSGKIWISSAREGIYIFDEKKFTNISTNNGLSSANISSLFTDSNGNIISVNKQGIDLIDSESLKVVSYSDEVGLHEIDSDINVFSIDSKGNSWIGIQNGIVKLAFKANSGAHEPDIILQSLLSFLTPVDTIGKIIFAYDDNHVSIDYFAIWYSNPSRVIYQYKLDGYNPNWVTTKDRTVVFPDLSPGKYKFSVTASHSGSFDYKNISTIEFTIRKPVWKETWFITLLLIIAAVAVNIYLRYRDTKIKNLEKLNRERVESQFEVLKNQVNPHFLFNSFNTLISVIENDKDIAVEYVNKLSDFFRCILTYRDTDLIKLEEELKLVGDYIFLQQKRYGNNFTVNFDESIKNYDQVLVPPLAIQTLLENALKHNAVSSETPLECKIYIENNLLIVVENNINIRISKEESTGVGIQNLRSRYKLLTGKDIEVYEFEGKFVVKLPIIKSG